MPRLDIERQKELEPKRMEYAINELCKLGYDLHRPTDNEINFIHKEHTIKIFPYSGWFSGKGIKQGRGIDNLLKQLK